MLKLTNKGHHMKKLNQKGFTGFEIVLLVLVLAALGFAGYTVWQKNKPDNQATTTVLTEQAQDKEVSQKNDPNEGYLVVKEWGLRFKAPAGLTDVKYVVQGDTTAFYAKPAGSSVQYRSDYEKFEDGRFRYAIGVLYRKTEAKSVDDTAHDLTTEGKKVGGYYYYTKWAFSSLATGAGCQGLYGDGDSECQTESVAFQLVNQGDKALLNTIEQAKE
jgi:hypothetical protein